MKNQIKKILFAKWFMVIEINAIKKDDKWYVDLSDEFKNEYSFLVPKDSEVYIENIKLNKEKYSQLKEFHYDVSYMYNGTKVYMDKYTFTTFYVDELNLKVQKDGFMSYVGNIDYYKDGYDNVEIRNKNYFTAILKPNNDKVKSIESFIKKYFDSVYNSINNNEKFTKIESFYKGDELKKDIQKRYKEKIDGLLDETNYSKSGTDSYKYKNIDYYEDGVYYLNNDCIIVVGTANYTYRTFYDWTSFMSSYEDEEEFKDGSSKIAIILQKDNDTYKIIDGQNLIP